MFKIHHIVWNAKVIYHKEDPPVTSLGVREDFNVLEQIIINILIVFIISLSSLVLNFSQNMCTSHLSTIKATVR
jgi:hypothetical protein